MSEQLRESVSAAMDGQASELELRRILATANADVVRSTWSSYHVAQTILQGHEHEFRFKDWDISQRVSDAITNEKIPMFKRVRGSAWFKSSAGFAAAASVAFTVVVGVQTLKQYDMMAQPADLASSTPSAVSNPVAGSAAVTSGRVYPSQSSGTRGFGNMLVGSSYGAQSDFPGATIVNQAAADLEAQRRLDKYMLRHTERAALNNGKGMISFARVASFEEQ